MSSPAVRRRAAAAASKPNTPASIAKSKAAKAQQKRDENWLKDAWLFTALTLSGIAIGLLAFVFFYSEGMGIGNIFKRSVPTFDAAAGAGRHDSSASTNGTTTQEQRVICSMPLPADYGCSESSCPLPTKEAGNCAAKYAQMDTVAELRMVDRNPVISVLEASPAKGSQPRHTVLLGPREHDDGGNINSYTRQPPTDNCATPAVNVTVVSTDPWLIVLDGFLTDEEVEHAMKLGVPGLQPSGQFHGDEEAKKAYDASYRTSSTAYLGKVRDPIVTCIERRASHFSAYPIGNIEALQFLRYNIGQEYKHHWDYFPRGYAAWDAEIEARGQRAVTFFVYLNDLEGPDAGGETDFPRLNAKVAPKKGRAAFWYDTDETGEGDQRTFHAGLPVKVGIKYGMNIWIRDRDYYN